MTTACVYCQRRRSYIPRRSRRAGSGGYGRRMPVAFVPPEKSEPADRGAHAEREVAAGDQLAAIASVRPSMLAWTVRPNRQNMPEKIGGTPAASRKSGYAGYDSAPRARTSPGQLLLRREAAAREGGYTARASGTRSSATYVGPCGERRLS